MGITDLKLQIAESAVEAHCAYQTNTGFLS